MNHRSLSAAWTEAETALPLGWRLRGIELLSDFTKPGRRPSPDVWHAWASEGMQGQGFELYGAGQTPAGALGDLTDKLRASGAIHLSG